MDIIFIAVVIGVITKLFNYKKKNNSSISEYVNCPHINFSWLYMTYTLFIKY